MAYTIDPTVGNLSDADLATLKSAVDAETAIRQFETTRADVQAYIDARSGLAARGATAKISNNGDPEWVIVEFPTDDPETLSGDKLALIIGGLAECVRGYGAQWVTPGKSVQNVATKMKPNLGAIEDAIQAASA